VLVVRAKVWRQRLPADLHRRRSDEKRLSVVW